MANNQLSKDPLVRAIEIKYKQLPNPKTLNPEQEKEIQDYFYNLTGEIVPTDWHQYFYSRTGIYSKEYIPRTLYRKILTNLPKRHSSCINLGDKNRLDEVLPNVLHPRIILKNINGKYYINNKPVSYQEAIDYCQNLGKVLIKPSNKARGKNVQIIDVKDGMVNDGQYTLHKLFSTYKYNFCIQEIIEQHSLMKALNPTSVNTIRILSYRSGDEVLILYTAIRIGRAGKCIDNESQGGISAKINSDGTLNKTGIGKPSEGFITHTDNGIALEGYEIPSYDKAVNIVKEQHLTLPYFAFIGWDLAINPNGDIVVVEINPTPALSQSACGPAFGKYTERIIKEIFKKNK